MGAHIVRQDSKDTKGMGLSSFPGTEAALALGQMRV